MFGKIKPYVPWLATSLLAMGFIFSNQSPQINTLRQNLTDLILIGAHPVNSILNAPRVWNENTRMREQLAVMSMKIARLGDSGTEALRLRRMMNFRERSSFKLITAEAIGMNPDPGIRSVLINAGSVDSVRVNDAVIVPTGVVGRIYRVGRRSSAVQLLLDPNLGVAGRIANSYDDGIIHSAGMRKLRLDGIPTSATIEVGDSVITSGLGGVFPQGLLIGYVNKISLNPNRWLLDIAVEPSADLGRLMELFIIQKADSAD
ncbi:MAG: rod shape-determining protein MreC [Candidatus Hatepunaea meridiana]|nr:rod shape-determining protein MreC [Candidatus Hatepunaea meridiana]